MIKFKIVAFNEQHPYWDINLVEKSDWDISSPNDNFVDSLRRDDSETYLTYITELADKISEDRQRYYNRHVYLSEINKIVSKFHVLHHST